MADEVAGVVCLAPVAWKERVKGCLGAGASRADAGRIGSAATRHRAIANGPITSHTRLIPREVPSPPSVCTADRPTGRLPGDRRATRPQAPRQPYCLSMRSAPRVILAVTLALAGCADGRRSQPPRTAGTATATGTPAERDPDLPLAPTRAAVQAACRQAGIPCPTLLPLSSEAGPRVTDFSSHGTTLLSVIDPAALVAPSGRPFGAAHLLLGQTQRELPLGSTPGERWPPRGLSVATYASVEDLRIASHVMTVPIRGGGTFVTARPRRSSVA